MVNNFELNDWYLADVIDFKIRKRFDPETWLLIWMQTETDVNELFFHGDGKPSKPLDWSIM